MDGYGKPGYTREEFQREMDDELNAVSSLDREYQPGGITVRTDVAVAQLAAVQAAVARIAGPSPDAMTVTYDRATEK